MASFPWVKITDGTYEQQYGFMERFFIRFLGEEGKATPFTIIATLGLDTWRALRFHHPGIAGLSDPTGKIYTIPATSKEVSDWEDATFKRHPTGTTADDIYGTAQRAAMMTLHFLPNAAHTSHQIVLQAEHQHIDGRGVFHLFDSFLTILTAPSLRDPSVIVFGEEWARLPPAMDDLMSLPLTPSEEDVSTARKWLAPMSKLTPATIPDPTPNQLNQPFPEQLLPQSRSIRSALPLSESETSAVLAACKAHNITLTSAWLAALALALDKPTPDNPSTPSGLTTFSTIDMRQYFPSDGSFNPKQQISCYHAFLPVAIPLNPNPKESLIPLASRMTEALHPPPTLDAERKSSYPTVIQLLGDPGLVSPLGVIDRYIKKSYGSGEGKVRVKDVWIADTMMGGTKLWMVHTWDGRLCLSVVFDGARFGRGRMEWVLERVRGELLGGLGVGERQREGW
ncbi:hypothetical protein QBC34DRAFT_451069 [Podospora aff. communis PSN243]|uniref:Uncharacterized protein n=1 Tax=Podospora aff. communis PSN243 TaxID=3040156 RepID=A0AAV9GD84_9PEZI|nr:hypothetical protein QBC34DRAFT_451069 [Podospora aff. communis PSN243]